MKNSDIYLEGCLYAKYMPELKVKNLESGDTKDTNDQNPQNSDESPMKNDEYQGNTDVNAELEVPPVRRKAEISSLGLW